MSRRRFLLGGPVLAMALLAACAPVTPRPAPAAATTADRFQLEGRLSVRQGEVRHHVGIDWRHTVDADDILLTGPLGQGLAELKRDSAGARLITSDRQIHTAADWETLAARVLGVRLPLSDLPRWLVGVLPELTFAGWQVDILERVGNRPVLLELRRDDIDVRIRVDALTELP